MSHLLAFHLRRGVCAGVASAGRAERPTRSAMVMQRRQDRCALLLDGSMPPGATGLGSVCDPDVWTFAVVPFGPEADSLHGRKWLWQHALSERLACWVRTQEGVGTKSRERSDMRTNLGPYAPNVG
jgi:hypothetical protein